MTRFGFNDDKGGGFDPLDGLAERRWVHVVEQDRLRAGLEGLVELVEGVDVGTPPDTQVVKFLPRIPIDPFTGEADWGKRSYQDDFDSQSWGGENVYDVYSLADGRALDGTEYGDW